ncbi:MAG: replicative DNA helicase [Deltaproteobacteria bacterium]|nr:replicative DNA helicase [Deltaproteobacteria bacterium]
MAVNKVQETLLYKVPPQNIEAEEALLGGILLDNTAITKVLEILGGDGDDFYRDAHRKIFRCMVSLFSRNEPIDLITLPEVLKNSNLLESVGGMSYLNALLDSTPTAANIIYYTRIVKEKAVLRRLINAATEIITRSYEGKEGVEDFLDDAERIIFQVSQDRIKQSFYPMKDLLKDTFKVIEKLFERKEHITGVPTGFVEFDRLTSGLQPSDLIIVAGRPSMGKTAFCLNIARYAAVEANVPVAIFSLEMSKEQLVQRLLSSEARVDSQKLRKGFLIESDWGRLTMAAGVLAEAPMYIDDTPAIHVLEIRAKARRLQAEKGLGLVIVDYLQLMKGRRDVDNREQEIADISRSLKALSKELNVPVVALSQLSRRAEQRERAKPQLADLRESGALEQDADVVVFLYREEYYKPCECPKELSCTCKKRGVADVMVAKQRNGPTDDIKLAFLSRYTLFANLDQVHTELGAKD